MRDRSAGIRQNRPVADGSQSFRRVKRSQRGYSVAEVDRFLDDARLAFQGRGTMSSSDIRVVSFTIEKGGYDTAAVDAGLDRLEDAFATRERERRLATEGQQAIYADVRTRAREIMGRLKRPAGKRFRTVGLLRQGYDRKQVDYFAGHLLDYFESRERLTVADVRSVAFTPRSNGYSEAQVDAFIDAVVEVMLAVRTTRN